MIRRTKDEIGGAHSESAREPADLAFRGLDYRGAIHHLKARIRNAQKLWQPVNIGPPIQTVTKRE